MASMLSLRPKLFRTRNPARDSNTDLDRLMSVRRAFAAAIADAEQERQGLQLRVDVYYAQATNLLDNSGDYGTRSREDEQSIADAEAQAVTATARIGQINAQIVKLGTMLAEFDRTMSDTAA
jgi:chromosome segregation ATPase